MRLVAKMVLLIKDFTWEQDEKYCFVLLPLKGANSRKVDTFSTEGYVKVSYPPYLWECFPCKPIEDRKSAVEIQDGKVLLKLVKHEQGFWEDLHHPKSDDKDWKKTIREEATKRSQERAEAEKKEKSEARQELGRFAVRKQMQLEDLERDRIQNIKETEIKQATTDLEKWREQQEMDLNQDMHNKNNKTKKNTPKNKNKDIFNSDQPVRNTGSIQVSFTPRVFPTPSRESTAPDEEEWLRKQAEAKRIALVDDQDLTEEEKNPQYLKEKGDNFYKSGNYMAAINAYTQGIRLSPKLPSLYSNRAACHLQLRNLFKCIEDCSKALDLLLPPVPQNAASRVKALIRRGTAFCQLEMYVEGLTEYEAALKIDPHNETLKADAENIRKVVQRSSAPS